MPLQLNYLWVFTFFNLARNDEILGYICMRYIRNKCVHSATLTASKKYTRVKMPIIAPFVKIRYLCIKELKKYRDEY
jgi:hypothetical protein